jgi:DNA repair protein RecN (Recombination protein N)
MVMLNLLRVSGFALIDEVEVPLGPGLTVITGETGAGKSILVEALGLLRGSRASAEMIRAGCDEARVEAVFELPAGWEVRERLLAEGRAVEDGLVVRRAVARSGRGRIHLGGSLASAADLAASVGKLVDITSQHDQHLLTDADSQLAILDAFAGNSVALVEVREAYQALSDARAELASFDADARARAEREDLLRFQLSELEQAEIQPGEDDVLRAERERTKGAEKFLAACSRGEEVLYSSDDAVSGRIAGVAREIAALAQLDPALLPVVETLRSAQAQVEDSAGELGRYASSIRFDPERLTEIEERLFLIGRLIRKHGGSVAAAIERREAISRELAALGSFEEGLAARKAAVEVAMKRMTALCEQISEQRRKAARVLGRRMDETLRDLGLAGARVPIAVEDRDEPGPRGKDRVRFLFAPNRGEEPRPLDRIASGGELSRVMLAVKQALAKEDEALTYVFDEVDSGVGGGTAEVIGRMLKSTAAHRQVLVVTHLPQIAAFADHHISVTKETSKGRTTIHVAVLTGGSSPSPEAAAHADEMLRRARS